MVGVLLQKLPCLVLTAEEGLIVNGALELTSSPGFLHWYFFSKQSIHFRCKSLKQCLVTTAEQNLPWVPVSTAVPI